MAKRCLKCGSAVADDAMFCEECGAKIEEAATIREEVKNDSSLEKEKNISASKNIPSTMIKSSSYAGEPELPKRMGFFSFLWSFIRWCLGGFMILGGLGSWGDSAIAAIFLMLSGILMIPQVTRCIPKFKMRRLLIAIAIMVFFIAGIEYMPESESTNDGNTVETAAIEEEKQERENAEETQSSEEIKENIEPTEEPTPEPTEEPTPEPVKNEFNKKTLSYFSEEWNAASISIWYNDGIFGEGEEVTVELDGEEIGVLKGGDVATYVKKLEIGKHTIEVNASWIDKAKYKFNVSERDVTSYGYTLDLQFKKSTLHPNGTLEEDDLSSKKDDLFGQVVIPTDITEVIPNETQDANVLVRNMMDKGVEFNSFDKKTNTISSEEGVFITLTSKTGKEIIRFTQAQAYSVYGLTCLRDSTSDAEELLGSPVEVEGIDLGELEDGTYIDFYEKDGNLIWIGSEDGVIIEIVVCVGYYSENWQL